MRLHYKNWRTRACMLLSWICFCTSHLPCMTIIRAHSSIYNSSDQRALVQVEGGLRLQIFSPDKKNVRIIVTV